MITMCSEALALQYSLRASERLFRKVPKKQARIRVEGACLLLFQANFVSLYQLHMAKEALEKDGEISSEMNSAGLSSTCRRRHQWWAPLKPWFELLCADFHIQKKSARVKKMNLAHQQLSRTQVSSRNYSCNFKGSPSLGSLLSWPPRPRADEPDMYGSIVSFANSASHWARSVSLSSPPVKVW